MITAWNVNRHFSGRNSSIGGASGSSSSSSSGSGLIVDWQQYTGYVVNHDVFFHSVKLLKHPFNGFAFQIVHQPHYFRDQSKVTSCNSDKLRIWDMTTEQLVREIHLNCQSSVTSMCSSVDGRTVITGSNDGTMRS